MEYRIERGEKSIRSAGKCPTVLAEDRSVDPDQDHDGFSRVGKKRNDRSPESFPELLRSDLSPAEFPEIVESKI